MSEVLGKIKRVNNTLDVSPTFKKREFVVTTEEQYPQHILIEFTQDKCDLLNKYKVGDSVKVGINIRGREWINPQGEARYFNTIQAWKIDYQTANNNQPNNQPQGNGFAYAPNFYQNQEAEDDLPF